MASEIRVNKIINRSGLSTVTFSDTGAIVSGIVTANNFSGDITGNVTGNVTGNISGATATFTGDVGVGGVLTYEDVTNIDSVGVITARDGLRVTGVTTITGTGEYLLQLNKSDSSAVYTQFTNSTSGTSTSDGFRIGMDSNEDGLVWLREDGNVKFGTNNTERLRLDTAGNTTISASTTSSFFPNATLNIISDKNVETGVDDKANYHLVLANPNNDTGEAIGLAFGITDTSSKVGAAIVHERDAAGSQGSLKFFTRPNNAGPPAERAKILADGGFLINSSTGQRTVVGTEYLSVHGGGNSNTVGIAAGVSHNQGIPFFASNGSNTTSQRLMRFAAGSGGDTRGTITFNGSSMVYGGSSDYRLKQNIKPISDGIAKLKKLNPINFDWIKETDNNNVMGFLAHEVQEVMPQVVTGTKDEVDSEGKPEYQELDYGGMTPLIVAALQDALSEIETLKARINNLEGN